jgi:hypothetical protein
MVIYIFEVKKKCRTERCKMVESLKKTKARILYSQFLEALRL